MTTKLVGVLAVKNAISQGYPFLEAIQSFLSVGDTLYISDGASTDGTEETLLRISKNKKIKLFLKQSWNSFSKKGATIGESYQNIVNIAKSDIGNKEDAYLMEVQANEVIHEVSYKDIRRITKLLSKQYHGVILPYQSMCGTYCINDSDWRLRIVPMRLDPRVFGDATTIHPNKELSPKVFFKELAGSVYRYVVNGTYYFRNFRRSAYFYKIATLQKPIFRYGFIFPDTIINKVSGHLNLYKNDRNYGSLKRYKETLISLSKKKLSTDEFYYYLALNLVRNERFSVRPYSQTGLLTNPLRISKNDHPKTMQGLLGKKAYYVREEIIKKIIQM